MRATGVILLVFSTLMAASCTGATQLAPFMSDETVRLEIDGVPVFTYDAPTCQLSYNEQRKEFRAMTDTMLDYFCITLSDLPSSAGSRASASVVWSTSEGERSRNEITLEAKRIKGDVIWLCDGSLHTAAVVRVLK